MTVIDALMHHARMDAFFFNGTYYFAPLGERAVRLIPLAEDISAEEARTALSNAGLILPGYQVTEVSNGGALVLSGPVQYLALSEGVLDALAAEPDVAELPIRVRRGGILESDTQTDVLSDENSEN